MNITFTGRHEEFTPEQRQKLEAKLAKLSKMIEHKGEREVHVILSQERFLHQVEITMNAYDHALVVSSSDADLFIALCDALEKLERQIVKLRTKWRDTHRHNVDKESQASAEIGTEQPSSETVGSRPRPRVFRVNHQDGRKPMTLEEAILELDEVGDYLVYRDAKTNRISVLLRRTDGNLDLIES